MRGGVHGDSAQEASSHSLSVKHKAGLLPKAVKIFFFLTITQARGIAVLQLCRGDWVFQGEN